MLDEGSLLLVSKVESGEVAVSTAAEIAELTAVFIFVRPSRQGEACPRLQNMWTITRIALQRTHNTANRDKHAKVVTPEEVVLSQWVSFPFRRTFE